MKKKTTNKLALVVVALLIVAVIAGIIIKGMHSDSKTVSSVDDLSGATIGVQLGTTGDIYVSDYEGDDAGTKIERYNKGTDAVQALLHPFQGVVGDDDDQDLRHGNSAGKSVSASAA